MGHAIAWSDSFAVGYETIDRQHRQLIDSINEIDNTIEAKDESRLAHLLKALRQAAEEHFRHENSVLWQIKTGTLKRRSSKARPRRVAGAMADITFDVHTADHAFLLADLDEIARAPLAAMGDLLKSWFVDHAIRRDSELKAIFQAMS